MNRLIAIILRSGVFATMSAGIEWLARRSDKQARQSKMPKEMVRQNSGRIRQTGRILRRLLRF